jgi:hypothetical protein
MIMLSIVLGVVMLGVMELSERNSGGSVYNTSFSKAPGASTTKLFTAIIVTVS